MEDKTLREKVEAFLKADARVTDFVISGTEGSLELALTLSGRWVAMQRSTAYAALETSIVQRWQMVYDRSYRWDRDVRPPNFDAWISSFTGETISDARMQVWLDDAIDLMRSVPHRRVIEIGCGIGLVAAVLAPGGEAYHGVDLSGEAIASLGAWAATRPELSHLQLAQGTAHDLDALGLPPNSADLAVINSVVQYFPDAAYLQRVLGQVAARIVQGGSIFLGDLRAAALLPLRAVNVAAAKAQARATVAKVREDAAALLGLARELAIDPGFLLRVADAIPRVGEITFSLKPEAVDHELSGYRYDAILHLDLTPAPPAPAAPAAPLDELLALIVEERPACVCFRDLPNKRLVKDVAFARALAAAEPDRLISDLVLEDDPSAIEPHDLAAAAKARGYTTVLRFTPGSPDGRFDALLRRPGTEAAWPLTPVAHGLSNDPLGEDLVKRLRRTLQTDLDAALGGNVRVTKLVAGPPTG